MTIEVFPALSKLAPMVIIRIAVPVAASHTIVQVISITGIPVNLTVGRNEICMLEDLES